MELGGPLVLCMLTVSPVWRVAVSVPTVLVLSSSSETRLVDKRAVARGEPVVGDDRWTSLRGETKKNRDFYCFHAIS